MLGEEFSAADVLIGSTLVWVQRMGLVGGDLPAVTAYLARLAARPAFQRATAD
jgi:glutathione S-transferase